MNKLQQIFNLVATDVEQLVPVVFGAKGQEISAILLVAAEDAIAIINAFKTPAPAPAPVPAPAPAPTPAPATPAQTATGA